MKKVSVIVPIYNVEAYLDDCIKSILNQTYSNLEIILVNDGSTDCSLLVCEKYKEDSRVFIYSKENGGLSDARNFGIDRATGDYICFVDSDDYIETDMISYLYENLVKYDSDISCCNIHMLYDNEVIPKHPLLDKPICMTSEEAIKDTIHNFNIDYASWNKMYKASLFENIRFPKGKIYEDMFIMHELLTKSNKIVYGSVCKYFYRQRENSITKSKFSIRNLDLVDAYDTILKFVQCYYPNLTYDVIGVAVSQKLNLIRSIFLSREFTQYKKQILRIRKSISHSELDMITTNKRLYFILRYCPLFLLRAYFSVCRRKGI